MMIEGVKNGALHSYFRW